MEDPVPAAQGDVTEKRAELEPHIILLQEFLGQQYAERFLDPSYEIPVSPVQPLHLESEGCGAKDYWRLLREHSEARLMRDVVDVPGAFMVKSSCLPPSKLQDRIKDYRRKLWLMSRASEINQEKAMLFMTNNPLPHVDEWQNLNKDRCLAKKLNRLEKTFHLPPLKATNSTWTKDKHIINVQAIVAGNNYRFLTEEMFHGSNDGFSKRYSDKSVRRQRPSLKGSGKHLTLIQQFTTHADENELPCGAKNDVGGSPAWEPLTYAALIDSKPSLAVPGRGHFTHGRPRQWFVNSSAYVPTLKLC
ncbi:testis-specific gene 13 protein [Mantella aurantiaca]